MPSLKDCPQNFTFALQASLLSQLFIFRTIFQPWALSSNIPAAERGLFTIYMCVCVCEILTNCRQHYFGLVGVVSAVLMSEMGVKLKKPRQMSHTYGITSMPCQSAQTRELVSISISICTHTCIHIYLSIHYKNIRQSVTINTNTSSK